MRPAGISGASNCCCRAFGSESTDPARPVEMLKILSPKSEPMRWPPNPWKRFHSRVGAISCECLHPFYSIAHTAGKSVKSAASPRSAQSVLDESDPIQSANPGFLPRSRYGCASGKRKQTGNGERPSNDHCRKGKSSTRNCSGHFPPTSSAVGPLMLHWLGNRIPFIADHPVNLVLILHSPIFGYQNVVFSCLGLPTGILTSVPIRSGSGSQRNRS